jgi:hypothetical protein
LLGRTDMVKYAHVLTWTTYPAKEVGIKKKKTKSSALQNKRNASINRKSKVIVILSNLIPAFSSSSSLPNYILKHMWAICMHSLTKWRTKYCFVWYLWYFSLKQN